MILKKIKSSKNRDLKTGGTRRIRTADLYQFKKIGLDNTCVDVGKPFKTVLVPTLERLY